MKKGYTPEIEDSERHHYLKNEAKKYSEMYHVGEKQMQEALCAVWGWDPKKYIGHMDGE